MDTAFTNITQILTDTLKKSLIKDASSQWDSLVTISKINEEYIKDRTILNQDLFTLIKTIIQNLELENIHKFPVPLEFKSDVINLHNKPYIFSSFINKQFQIAEVYKIQRDLLLERFYQNDFEDFTSEQALIVFFETSQSQSIKDKETLKNFVKFYENKDTTFFDYCFPNPDLKLKSNHFKQLLDYFSDEKYKPIIYEIIISHLFKSGSFSVLRALENSDPIKTQDNINYIIDFFEIKFKQINLIKDLQHQYNALEHLYSMIKNHLDDDYVDKYDKILTDFIAHIANNPQEYEFTLNLKILYTALKDDYSTYRKLVENFPISLDRFLLDSSYPDEFSTQDIDNFDYRFLHAVLRAYSLDYEETLHLFEIFPREHLNTYISKSFDKLAFPVEKYLNTYSKYENLTFSSLNPELHQAAVHNLLHIEKNTIEDVEKKILFLKILKHDKYPNQLNSGFLLNAPNYNRVQSETIFEFIYNHLDKNDMNLCIHFRNIFEKIYNTGIKEDIKHFSLIEKCLVTCMENNLDNYRAILKEKIILLDEQILESMSPKTNTIHRSKKF